MQVHFPDLGCPGWWERPTGGHWALTRGHQAGSAGGDHQDPSAQIPLSAPSHGTYHPPNPHPHQSKVTVPSKLGEGPGLGAQKDTGGGFGGARTQNKAEPGSLGPSQASPPLPGPGGDTVFTMPWGLNTCQEAPVRVRGSPSARLGLCSCLPPGVGVATLPGNIVLGGTPSFGRRCSGRPWDSPVARASVCNVSRTSSKMTSRTQDMI